MNSSPSHPVSVPAWHVRHTGPAALAASDFHLVETPLARPAEGEVLIRTRWISLDPYLSFPMIGSGSDGGSWAVAGRTIGEVMESRDAAVPVGATVLVTAGWQPWNVVPADQCQVLAVDPRWPVTVAFGVLGASGLTAWVGMTLGDPQPGETVMVSAATGPVGSVAGQIAKSRGCRVIGIAGGPEKCALAVARYGFDLCLDHRQPDLASRLSTAAPEGIGMLFENVGAPSLDPALTAMALDSRVILCGLAGHYSNSDPIALANFRLILKKHVTIRPFAWMDHAELYPAGRAWLTESLAAGRLAYEETITEGLAAAPESYIRMLAGKGSGKHLIHLP